MQYINECQPTEKKCFTEKYGTNQCSLAIRENIMRQFGVRLDDAVIDGMCADVAIHNTDGHNPHAHIMLTVRPLNENGTWQHKTEKEYLCIRNGEEKGFTSSEYAKAVSDGWEKQYPYMVNGKKKYLPPSQAEGYG